MMDPIKIPDDESQVVNPSVSTSMFVNMTFAIVSFLAHHFVMYPLGDDCGMWMVVGLCVSPRI